MVAAVTVEEKDVLSHLTGRWMCPITLRKVLKEAGVNIFPGEYSYKYVSVNKKVSARVGFPPPQTFSGRQHFLVRGPIVQNKDECPCSLASGFCLK